MTWSVGVSQMGVVGGRNLLEDLEGWIMMDRCLDVEIVGTCCMYAIAIWNDMIILYNHSKLDLNEIMSRYFKTVGCELLDWNMSDPWKKRSIFRHCFMELHVSILNTLKQVILQ